MNPVKASLHQIIDTIEDDDLLKAIHDLLNERNRQKAGKIWDSLSELQKRNVIAAEEEIRYADKQVSHDEMIKKNKRWLDPDKKSPFIK
jgi:predicted P-loop ATPase